MNQNRRILAADDDPLILAVYRKLFLRETFEKRSVDGAALDDLLGLEGVVPAQSGVESPQRAPYDLDTFPQGLDAVDALERALRDGRPYAVALIDMRMPPGIDGLETAQRMRASDPQLQIIFVTAFSDHGTDTISHQLGGDTLWFRKPFEGEELYQTVRSCCTSWNRGHELQQLKQNLAWRVDLQTRRLNEKLQSMELLQSNSLSREQQMGQLKRENQCLKAYQDLRLLFSQQPLPQPYPPQHWPIREAEAVTLLLVDDSATVRALYQTQLEAIGYRVVSADSVDQGMVEALRHAPDLALIDYYMPGGGDRLIARLREDERTARMLPLLFTNAEDEIAAVDAGAVYWIRKETGMEEILQQMALIRDYIQRRKAEQNDQAQTAHKHIELDSPQPSATAAVPNRRVLLVDDEQDNLDLLRSILGGGRENRFEAELETLINEAAPAAPLEENPGAPDSAPRFELVAVDQGSRAILAVEQAQRDNTPFAVALIDMRMPPGIDGLETARQIRQISPEIEIVIITAYSDYSLKEIQQVLGMNFSFMTKPYNTEVVLQRVVEGCSKWANSHRMQGAHRALLNLATDMESEIARRRETEEKLEQANRTKDEFLSSMSHELRTPLTTMIGYNEMMAEESQMPKQYREMAQSSLLAGKTLLQLVNDILDMSKIRAGKFELNEQPFELRRVIRDVGELMQVFGSQKGVGVEIHIDPAVEPHLSHRWIGDEMRLTQILFNLLSNAVKFSDGGGSVTLRLWLSPVAHSTPHSPAHTLPGLKSFTIEVVDHGIGMSEAAKSRLFTPFEQADSSTARRFGGTGLGLYISKQLIEMMGGEIRVISEEGAGSTFQLRLPLKASEIAVEAIEETGGQQTQIPTLEGEILLAEDTIQLQRLATLLIEKSGANVTLANNGLEALELGQKNHYQLILMDMQMPEMDGIEATRRLREKGVTTPIVALTANVMQQHKEQFERAGCDGFLSKPIQRSLLYRLLAQHLPAASAQPEDVAHVTQEAVAQESAPQSDSEADLENDLSDLMDEEMMQEFWDYIAEAKDELQQAWEQGDWEQLRKTAHAIKGMGSSYGQPKMTQAAATLQDLAPQGERAALSQPLERLLHVLQPVP